MLTHTTARLYDDGPQVGDSIEEEGLRVEIFAVAELPTRWGTFQIAVFHNSADDFEHVALIRGDLREVQTVPVRLHSECLTGDVLGSLRCDCRAQLELALSKLGESQHGALLYLRQEGRGIGLGQKIRAYTLQEQGMDTFEANEHLGFDADLRDYRVAAMMLRLMGVRSVRLVTNNPAKVQGLEDNGVHVQRREPSLTERNPHNRDYLSTKARSGHHLPID